MRTVQQIFDAVIDGGLYKPRDAAMIDHIRVNEKKPENVGKDWTEYCEYDEYMCNSLLIARKKKVITDREYCLVSEEVNSYIRGWVSLSLLLRNMHGRTDIVFSDLVNIYRNWDNRPIYSE